MKSYHGSRRPLPSLQITFATTSTEVAVESHVGVTGCTDTVERDLGRRSSGLGLRARRLFRWCLGCHVKLDSDSDGEQQMQWIEVMSHHGPFNGSMITRGHRVE